MSNTVSKETKIVLFGVFLWIALLNLIVQTFHIHPGWPLFISTAVFFLLPGEDTSKKLQTVFFGGLVGLGLAWLFLQAEGMLSAAGLAHVAAIMLPLTVVLFILIILHPVLPTVLNNVGFVYFIAALIDPSSVLKETPALMLSLVVGGIVINGGAILIHNFVVDYYRRKATAETAVQS